MKVKIKVPTRHSSEGKVMDYHDFCTPDMPEVERRRLNIGDIYINAVTCKKCGDKVRSRNRHDFRYCKCGNVAVDGGSWYQRIVGDVTSMSEVIYFSDVKYGIS